MKSACESPVTSTWSGRAGVGWTNDCCRDLLRLGWRIAVEPFSSSVPEPVFDSWPKARSNPLRGRWNPIAPATSSTGWATASTMSRVVPGFMLSPARTIASELKSIAISSAITITPRTRPAGIVRWSWRSRYTGQNW
jgi:hypothetical protein